MTLCKVRLQAPWTPMQACSKGLPWKTIEFQGSPLEWGTDSKGLPWFHSRRPISKGLPWNPRLISRDSLGICTDSKGLPWFCSNRLGFDEIPLDFKGTFLPCTVNIPNKQKSRFEPSVSIVGAGGTAYCNETFKLKRSMSVYARR